MCPFPGQMPVEPSPVQRTDTSDEKTDSFSATSREEPTGRLRTHTGSLCRRAGRQFSYVI